MFLSASVLDTYVRAVRSTSHAQLHVSTGLHHLRPPGRTPMARSTLCHRPGQARQSGQCRHGRFQQHQTTVPAISPAPTPAVPITLYTQSTCTATCCTAKHLPRSTSCSHAQHDTVMLTQATEQPGAHQHTSSLPRLQNQPPAHTPSHCCAPSVRHAPSHVCTPRQPPALSPPTPRTHHTDPPRLCPARGIGDTAAQCAQHIANRHDQARRPAHHAANHHSNPSCHPPPVRPRKAPTQRHQRQPTTAAHLNPPAQQHPRCKNPPFPRAPGHRSHTASMTFATFGTLHTYHPRTIIAPIRSFAHTPGPNAAVVQCYILRDTVSGGKRFPRYSLFLEEGQRFLLSAQRRKGSKTSNYVISTNQEEPLREGPTYLGKLRSNLVGTEFTVYDDGCNPKKMQGDCVYSVTTQGNLNKLDLPDRGGSTAEARDGPGAVRAQRAGLQGPPQHGGGAAPAIGVRPRWCRGGVLAGRGGGTARRAGGAAGQQPAAMERKGAGLVCAGHV